jgi:Thiamine pyrophosphate enzyme, C-terminal TPP binding domain
MGSARFRDHGEASCRGSGHERSRQDVHSGAFQGRGEQRRGVGIPRPPDHRPDRRRGPYQGLGDLLTQVQRKTPVVQIILNNGFLDFVNIEQQEAGIIPFGVEFKNPDFAKVAEAFEVSAC